MIKIDGKTYDVDVICDDLEEQFEILASEDSGRTQDGTMWIDVIGTFYNMSMHIQRRPTTTVADYDDLFQTLSAPVDFHTVEFPHGQGTMSCQMYVSSGSRKLLRQRNGENRWGDMTIQFVARAPQRRP